MVSLRRFLPRRPIVEYVTWEDAAATAAGAYSDTLVNQFRAARTALNLKLGWLPDILETPLAWLSMVFPGPLAITDLGGATGEIGLALTQFRPDITYTVVENPTLVSIMVPQGAVRFAREMPAKCDIFYTSGTLQYLQEPYQVFEEAAKSAYLGLALARNCFADREIISVQESRLHDNGAGGLPEGFPNNRIAYPHRTISEPMIGAIAAACGFKLVSRLPNESGVPAGHDGYGADLVFLKT